MEEAILAAPEQHLGNRNVLYLLPPSSRTREGKQRVRRCLPWKRTRDINVRTIRIDFFSSSSGLVNCSVVVNCSGLVIMVRFNVASWCNDQFLDLMSHF
ncbi:hypothetical protein CEXT_542371 [Caerostris extrusa]|uniref:Uncharacterized protein n=1 Tax=Caerostris extrusa TaxID=172846 RepID=A0AAV4NNS8_CAEEX|nr:hypothetical protein CEXT_542371 [Caerostris extrusa]